MEDESRKRKRPEGADANNGDQASISEATSTSGLPGSSADASGRAW